MRESQTDHILTPLKGYLEEKSEFWGSDHRAFVVNL